VKLETKSRPFESNAKLSRPGLTCAITVRWSPSTRITSPTNVSSTWRRPAASNFTAAGVPNPVATVRMSPESTSMLTTSPLNQRGP
jgi:hypothetical protein